MRQTWRKNAHSFNGHFASTTQENIPTPATPTNVLAIHRLPTQKSGAAPRHVWCKNHTIKK